ncbi:MAG: hypothetical protein DRQ88_07610 [Epsilonproteobacteria bacterium]|nr:MAG: hypothetical protein DRQ88_07610 [Campylobacterota bacterium]
MRVPLSLLVFVFLVSCGGTPTKNKSKRSYDDLGDINKYQKKPKVSKRYSRKTDRFPFGKDEEDVLISESLARVSSKIAGKVAGDDDPISQIIGNCYKKDYNDAFEVADKNYESYKKNPAYWNQVGTCFLLKNEQRKASIFYNKARSLNLRYTPAINNIGVIYLQRGKDQLALRQFKKAIRLNPSAKTPKFNQANIYLRYGLHQKACSIFSALNTSTPRDVDVVNALAVCNMLRRRYNSAIARYKSMDRDFHERPYIGINYALALKLSGEKGEAQDILDDIDISNLGVLKKYYRSVKNFIARGRR